MKIRQTIILLFLSNSLLAQAIEETIPKIYHVDTDTVRYKYSAYPDTFKLVLKHNDTISPGTDVSRGIIMTAFLGKDTLRIPGDNFPYARKSFVTIETPKGRSVVAFRYNSTPAGFSEAYMAANDGKVTFEVPEVYELANIIWTLSPSGQRATDLNKNTAYYKEAERYFSPYLDHPVFKKLDFPQKEYAEKYYTFRENSFAYKFQGNRIINTGSHYYVMGNDWDGFTSLFSELLPLVEDFAAKSRFRKFYKEHQRFYTAATKRVEELLPVKEMWAWLEKEFPGGRFNAYKIVFSPLIGGSHSTQRYSGKNPATGQWYEECVMFICGATRYDDRKELTELQKEGLMSGVVFTEIDHNYVNPASSKYQKEISSIFNKPGFWASGKEQWYSHPVSIFNEYMTHALFCLWVHEKYDDETAKLVIAEREAMNVDKRSFYKFREFNRALLKLREENPGLVARDLYPLILKWSKEQVQ